MNIEVPNKTTAKYIGCAIHLYIPAVISGALGLGIGETLTDGLSAINAAITIIAAVTDNIVVRVSTQFPKANRDLPGRINSNINKLNCRKTSKRALLVFILHQTFFQRILAVQVHFHDLGIFDS